MIGSFLPPRATGKVSLPTLVSKTKPNKPLSTTASRRHPRLHTPEGFHHVQLESTPRKRRRLPTSTDFSLDAPPKPTDVVLPAPVPLEILQGWGLQCNVPPSEVTQDALLKEKMQNEDDEA